MKDEKDIRDDEIRVIGNSSGSRPKYKSSLWWILVVALMLVILGLLTVRNAPKKSYTEGDEQDDYLLSRRDTLLPIGSDVGTTTTGFCEIVDTMINDIPLRLYIPHNAEMSLHVGPIDREDPAIIYAAQAADLQRDGKIVGAFVLKGEPLAWGLSKKGFCASIDGKVTVGVADNSPLFEEATEREGYFFRQYPLVKNGRLVENKPKNKSLRRAICDRSSMIFMIESLSRESFHDFAEALVDLGVDQAVYLVGSSTYGWAVDAECVRHEFGNINSFMYHYEMSPNVNYIVWRKKSDTTRMTK